MLYLMNDISLKMFDIDDTIRIKVIPLSLEHAKVLVREDKDILISVIEHEDTARIISNLLGEDIKPSSISVKLTPQDYAIIAQYTGPRLPEGSTKLPELAEIKFYMVLLK